MDADTFSMAATQANDCNNSLPRTGLPATSTKYVRLISMSTLLRRLPIITTLDEVRDTRFTTERMKSGVALPQLFATS